MAVPTLSKGLTCDYIVQAMVDRMNTPTKRAAVVKHGAMEKFTGTVDQATIQAAQQKLRKRGSYYADATLTYSNGKGNCTVTVSLPKSVK